MLLEHYDFLNQELVLTDRITDIFERINTLENNIEELQKENFLLSKSLFLVISKMQKLESVFDYNLEIQNLERVGLEEVSTMTELNNKILKELNEYIKGKGKK